MEKTDKKSYRNSIVAIIKRKDGKLLITLNPRTNSLDPIFIDKNTFKFPQGGIDNEEIPEFALYRELKEELGLHLEKESIKAKLDNYISYWFKSSNGPDFEIRLHAFLLEVDKLDENTLKPDPEEIAEIRWIEPKKVEDLDLGIRHEAYLSILKKFDLI